MLAGVSTHIPAFRRTGLLEIRGMSEPSSGASHRQTQISPHVIPSDGSPAPSSGSIQSPLSPGSGLAPLGPTSRPSSGFGPAQFQSYSTPGPGSRHGTFPQPFYPAQSTQNHSMTLPGYHEISHGTATFADTGPIPINPQMQGPHGQKRAYRQRRKDPSCDACRERKVKVSICQYQVTGSDTSLVRCQ